MDDEVEVGQSDYQFVDEPTTVFTEGLGPCIGIAYLNHTQKRAGVCHVPGANAAPSIFESFVGELAGQTADEDIVEMWAVGGEADDPDYADAVHQDRAFVVNRLKQTFPNGSVQAKWTEGGIVVSGIRVETAPCWVEIEAND